MNADGLNHGTSGNVSVRVEDGILITPTGMAYEELSPDDLVEGTQNIRVLSACSEQKHGCLTQVDVTANGLQRSRGNGWWARPSTRRSRPTCLRRSA